MNSNIVILGPDVFFLLVGEEQEGELSLSLLSDVEMRSNLSWTVMVCTFMDRGLRLGDLGQTSSMCSYPLELWEGDELCDELIVRYALFYYIGWFRTHLRVILPVVQHAI